MSQVWQQCLSLLDKLLSEQDINTWIRPVQAFEHEDTLLILAPNRFVRDWVEDNFLKQIAELVNTNLGSPLSVKIQVGSQKPSGETIQKPSIEVSSPARPQFTSNLNPHFTFDNFVQGKSNQLARAASLQVAENPGTAYNPILIYGGVGLGKTHLIHAIGNEILRNAPNARVTYLHSERFVADMIKALQHNAMDQFKMHYRSLDALLIDDIPLPERSRRH